MSLRRLRRFGLFAAPWLALSFAAAAFAHGPQAPAGPDFVPPPPGSYRLHAIMPAPDGTVVDADGRTVRLAHLLSGRVTVLGFVYTRCSDARGCPLAYRVFYQLKAMIERDARLRGKAQLVTLSFDPAHDTPGVMRRYAGKQLDGNRALRWHFLTTRSREELRPLLEGFDQDLEQDMDPVDGTSAGTLSHVLKVFLIDRHRNVREIYTTSFLFTDVVLGDIRTLLMEP